MQTAFVDVKWARSAGGDDPAPGAGWVRFSGPRSFPSPGLLARAGAASRDGAEVVFRYLSTDEAKEPPEDLAKCDRVVISAPPVHRAAAEALAAALAGPEVELFDPWAAEVGGDPQYGLAGEVAIGHAEVDVMPAREAVHPWACPLPNGPTEDWEARLAAAAASFQPNDPALLERPIWQAWERDLYLNDHRIPTDMDRLRGAARLISKSLKEHSTMLKLHLRVWPSDILEHPRVPDHLTLLNVGSLDLLVGTTRGQCDLPGALSTEDVTKAINALAEAGMSHLTGVSLLLGLPGESGEDGVVAIKHALKLCLEAKVRRIRVAMWLGEDVPPPATAEAHFEAFMAAHPDWHPLEYNGMFDFLEVVRGAMKGVQIIGPGYVPGWASATPE